MAGGGDDNIEANAAIAALVISIIALFVTVMQMLQQYFASAYGYSNCGERVVGQWSESKKRVIHWSEFRFEVQFEAPVIFVAPPTNENGPIPRAPIYYLNGSRDSLVNTRTLLPQQELTAQKQRNQKARIHTADNERATWVAMLSFLQAMEQESQEWQESQYAASERGPGQRSSFKDHTLAVAVQRKQRSWDNQPAGVKKPYATTTICHIVEMAAMLGIHWQEFDRSRERYRAEGNGFVLNGANVADLGLMFDFQICGKHRFEENRLIPVHQTKELCFGFVPTLFRLKEDPRLLDIFGDEPNDLSVLQLGSTAEVAETLVLIGCNAKTVNQFQKDGSRLGHLFPIVFEIMGMLGRTLHIKNSSFRMLPNPSTFKWDKRSFSLRKLLLSFNKRLRDADLIAQTPQTARLVAICKKLIPQLGRGQENEFKVDLLDTLHDAIDECDRFLSNDVPQDKVMPVLRTHIQEVVRFLNEASTSDDGSGFGSGAIGFADLMSAAPEDRQTQLMEIYFVTVLRRVLEQSRERPTRANTTFLHHALPSEYAETDDEEDDDDGEHGAKPGIAIHIGGSQTDVNGSAQPTHTPGGLLVPPKPASEDGQSAMDVPTDGTGTGGGGNGNDGGNGSPDSAGAPSIRFDAGAGPRRVGTGFSSLGRIEELERDASNIWCTFVFRMLCWLLLHDFHKNDVQIQRKSELLGSRLPVYIG